MKKLGIKFVVLGVVGLVVNNITALAPAFNNNLAMLQMQNDNMSLVANNLLNSLEKGLWVAFVVFAILLFKSDIRKLYKKEGKADE